MRHCRIADVTIVLGLFVGLGAATPIASADELMPIAIASIHDSPRDGLGDSFNNSPFEGLLRQTSTQEDRAILEYDVSPYSGLPVAGAWITGQIFVNNAYDNGTRSFDLLLYEGNGLADLSDFEIPATFLAQVFYDYPYQPPISFNIDITAEVEAMITGGALYIGFKADCASEPNYPNILTDDTTLTILIEAPPPCPEDVNGDDVVNVLDLLAVIAAWGAGGGPEDVNNDGTVDVLDLLAVIAAWGPC